METVGHLTKKMLERYAHPPTARRRAALDTFDHVSFGHTADTQLTSPHATTAKTREIVREFGGRQEARTPDLRVANAALSQLS